MLLTVSDNEDKSCIDKELRKVKLDYLKNRLVQLTATAVQYADSYIGFYAAFVVQHKCIHHPLQTKTYQQPYNTA